MVNFEFMMTLKGYFKQKGEFCEFTHCHCMDKITMEVSGNRNFGY